MNKFNNKISIFLTLALVILHNQTMQASNKIFMEIGTLNQPPRLNKARFSDPLQDILQKIKNGQYVSEISLDYIENNALEEMKRLASTIKPNDDMFDSWITLILMVFLDDPSFDNSLKIAKEKGENEGATPAAQSNLGTIYYKGLVLEQDFNKAIELYKEAANLGDTIAQNNLGLIYYQGQGIDQDLTEASKWFKKAAHQGDATAQYNLGCMYFQGEGVDQDLTEAFKWIKKAAHQGDDIAQNNLGFMYYKGLGVNQDLLEASKWLKKAADQKHADAQFNLGFMYYYGEGYTIDFAKSFEWNQKAANQKHADAQKNLAHMYQYGQGVDQDLAQSLKWYLESFKNTDVEIEIGLKDSIKKIITFAPSTITRKDQESYKTNQKILKDNIKTFLGSQDMKKSVNQLNCSSKKRKLAIPSFLKKEGLLDVIDAYQQPGFMVTCLQPQDVKTFILSRSPDIKGHRFQGQSFLTFGQSNIQLADKLIEIFLAAQNKLIGKAEDEPDIPAQLEELLIKGIPYRNKIFLENNDYIERIFKN